MAHRCSKYIYTVAVLKIIYAGSHLRPLAPMVERRGYSDTLSSAKWRARHDVVLPKCLHALMSLTRNLTDSPQLHSLPKAILDDPKRAEDYDFT